MRAVLCWVAQSCPTLCARGLRPPGSSVPGVLQARTLEWVAMPSSRGSSWPRDWTQVFHITGGFFTVWVPQTLFISNSTKWLGVFLFLIFWPHHAAWGVLVSNQGQTSAPAVEAPQPGRWTARKFPKCVFSEHVPPMCALSCPVMSSSVWPHGL